LVEMLAEGPIAHHQVDLCIAFVVGGRIETVVVVPC
jgi:hypothetical protein